MNNQMNQGQGPLPGLPFDMPGLPWVEALVDVFPGGLVVVDAEGALQMASPEAARLLGLTWSTPLRSHLGWKDWTIVRLDGHPMPKEDFPSFLARKRGQTVRGVELGVARPGRTTVWLSVTATPLPDGQLLALIRDIGPQLRDAALFKAHTRITEGAEDRSAAALFHALMEELSLLTGSQVALGRILDIQGKEAVLDAWASPAGAEGAENLPDMGKILKCLDPTDRIRRAGKAFLWNDRKAGNGPRGAEPCRFDKGLLLPVHRGGRLRAILGVGDRSAPYDEDVLGDCGMLAEMAWDHLEVRLAREEATRRAEHLESIAASTPCLISSFRLTADGTRDYDYLSPAVEDIFGIPAGLMRDEPNLIHGRAHPEDAERLKQGFARAAADGTRYHDRWRYDHPRKGWRWLEGWSTPRESPDGGRCWYGFVMDITPLEEVRLALQREQALLGGAFDQAPVGMALTGIDGRILRMNQRLAAMMGCEPEDMTGRQVPFLAAAAQAAATAGPGGAPGGGDMLRTLGERRYVRSDGSTLWVRLGAARVPGTEGRPDCFVVHVEDLEERVQVERELAELREQFTVLIQDAPASLAMFDRSMNYLAASRRWCAEFDLPAPPIGRCHYEVFPEVGEAWKAVHRRALAGETISGEAEPFTRQNGRVHWIRWQVRPWRTADDTIGGIVIFSEDVTLRHLAERDREALRARHSAALAALTDAVVIMDDKGKFIDFNDAFVHFLRIQDRSQCPASLEQLAVLVETRTMEGRPIPPSEWLLPRALRGETFMNQATFNQRLDTGVSWTSSTSVSPIRDGDGRIVGAVMSCRDISEFRRLEEALNASETVFNILFRSAPVLISLSTWREGRILEVNEAFCRTTGYLREEVVGRTSLELGLFSEEERMEMMRVFSAEGRLHSHEFRLSRKDGSVVEGLLSVVETVIAGERHFLSMILDVTGLKASDRRRAELEREVEHLQRLDALGRLAGGVSHDMNNVLGVIMATTSLLKVQYPGDPAIQQEAALLEGAAIRGRDLVRGLRDFSRKELDSASEVDLNALVLQEAELMERTTLKRVEIRTEIQPGLPPILGEASALGTALMNLCVNACDAMPAGGILVLSTRNLGKGWIQVSVQDDGEGMPPEVQARAMEPFFTTKPAGKGTGLGLSRVYGTVKAHGGTLEIQSRLGAGTRIDLSFPVTQQTASAGAAGDTSPRGGERPLSILLVDDESLVRMAYKRLLEVMGHRPTIVSSGMEALRHLTAGLPVDLIMLDINMPGLDGAETLAQIRRLGSRVPVLLISGHSDERIPSLLEKLAPARILAKPFTQPELSTLLREWYPNGWPT